jgi:hypothetical protein
VGMTRNLRNWNYQNVTNFLRENGFSFSKPLKGSHQEWRKPGENGEPDIIVEVNFSHRSYPVKTLKIFIRHSEIDASEWIKWGGS